MSHNDSIPNMVRNMAWQVSLSTPYRASDLPTCESEVSRVKRTLKLLVRSSGSRACAWSTQRWRIRNVRWTLCLSNSNACPQDQHWAQVERVARQHLGDGVHASPKILRSHGTSAQSHAVALSYTPIFVLEHLPRDAEAQPVVTEQHQCGEQCNHRGAT